MVGQAVLALALSLPLEPGPPARPLAVVVATQAQAMDARLHERGPTTAAVEPTAASPNGGRWSRLSRGKKVAIVAGILVGAAVVVAVVADDDGGSGGGGGY